MIPSNYDLIIIEQKYPKDSSALLKFLSIEQVKSPNLACFYFIKNEVVTIIPKVIHYVWLGRGEKSNKIKECIASWKKFMPDYEIIEWNEDNFDINYNDFTRQSYEAKQYAFTSDVVRLYALYHRGGIYLDTDVLMYKPLYDFENELGFSGFEDTNYPVTATMRSRSKQSCY